MRERCISQDLSNLSIVVSIYMCACFQYCVSLPPTKMFQLSLLLIPLLSLLPLPAAASFDDYSSFVYVGCSQSKYTLGSAYQLNVDSLLTSLANSAAFAPYKDFICDSASGSSPAYGLFQCRADLPAAACAACVHSALDQISSLCPSADGAGVQLKGCFLRYAKDSFIGKPDETLFYKRCGAVAPAGGGDGSALVGMRDSALAGIAASVGGYRVGSGGQMHALAQCVGDQGEKECGECVATAVAQVKAACGGADAGDAYLGKCYVSYWSGGIYTSRHYYHGQVTGKTLAIILGVTIGIVILIIFLTFMRRRGGK